MIICTGSCNTDGNQWLFLLSTDITLSRPYQYVSSPPVLREMLLFELPELENLTEGMSTTCNWQLRSIGMIGSCLCEHWLGMITASLIHQLRKRIRLILRLIVVIPGELPRRERRLNFCSIFGGFWKSSADRSKCAYSVSLQKCFE
jgi:hypothetical protein